MIELKTVGGMRISEACKEAADLATAKQETVQFVLNDTAVIANPGVSAAALEAQWVADFNAKAKAYGGK